MDVTWVVLSHTILQDVDVDFEPLLLSQAGLCAVDPVFWFQLLSHPGLFGNFLFSFAVKVVNHPVVQQTHGCKLVDARESEIFGEGGVDVMEGMCLWKSHRKIFIRQIRTIRSDILKLWQHCGDVLGIYFLEWTDRELWLWVLSRLLRCLRFNIHVSCHYTIK